MDFEELYSLHYKDVYRYLLSLCGNSHTAEDIASETFIKAIKAIDKFDGKGNIRVWLCQIAKNTYFTQANKAKFHTEMPDDIADGSSIELEFVNKSQAFEIHKILHILDEPYKEVFSLRLFSELSFAEIGEIFEKSESWARVTFHRAKLKIKESVAK